MVVVGVILSFRFIPEKNFAGTVAGSLFLFSTIYVLIFEWSILKKNNQKWSWALLGGLQFLILSVIPILFLRAVTWGTLFNEARWGILQGSVLHSTSSYTYLVFLVGIFISLMQARIEKLRSASDK